MKIGFDISQTGQNKAGCGFFADSLILALKDIDNNNEYILYPHFGNSFWDPDALENTRQISSTRFSTKIIEKSYRDLIEFWEHMPEDAENRLGNPDIIHANNYFCPRNLKKAKVVYTLYDLSVLEHPEFTTEQNRGVCFNGLFDAANNADFVISISDYSRNKFLQIFPHFPPARIAVIYPGSRFQSDYKISKISQTVEELESARFWLAVGTLEPRKNLRRLLKAYSVYKTKSERIYPLVLVGGKGWFEDDLEEFVAKLDLVRNVRFLGYVSDEKLNWLYGNCFAFIYPSLYEGFGMPVLEAMGNGAAVIVSNATSLPEVAGEAGHYINPLSEKAITEAICLLADDEAYRLDLKKLALDQAYNFSWQQSAMETLEVYKHVMTLGKR